MWAYYHIDSLTESASVFRLRQKPRPTLFQACDVYFLPACFAIRRFGGRPVQTSALEYIFPHPDVGLRYDWETGVEIRILFSTRPGPQLATLILAVHLDTGLIVRFPRRSSPRPGVREASIFQFARGINWRWLSRAARRATPLRQFPFRCPKAAGRLLPPWLKQDERATAA